MTQVRKAVIPAAGMGTRQYPASSALPKGLFTIVDRDGLTKAAIQLSVEEAQAAGIEEICIVIRPGDEELYQKYFQSIPTHSRPAFEKYPWAIEQSEKLARLRGMITYIPQTEALGYGHAVYCAREWVKNEPFLVMLSDHVFLSRQERVCARQLIEGYKLVRRSVYALQRISEEGLQYFGTIQGDTVTDIPGMYRLTNIKEKPDVDYARRHLRVDGMPHGTYLSFFGQHILTPGIFDALDYFIRNRIREKGEFQFTNAQELLREREGAYGLEIDGSSFDMGVPQGFIETQMALALNGKQRHAVSAYLRQLSAQ